MNKTKSVIVLSLILVVVLFLGIFTFLPKVDFGYQTYNSPINLINKSQDLGSGYFSVMSLDKGKLTDEEYATAKDKMVESIKTRLSTYGIYDATISVADNQATIQVADTADVSTALSLVSQRGKFVFATVKAEELTDDKIITTSDGVKGATSKYYSGDNAYALSKNTTLTTNISAIKSKLSETEKGIANIIGVVMQTGSLALSDKLKELEENKSQLETTLIEAQNKLSEMSISEKQLKTAFKKA
ncbi:MAG: hypothetical protein RR291_05180, partial [Clostridia bacterium]